MRRERARKIVEKVTGSPSARFCTQQADAYTPTPSATHCTGSPSHSVSSQAAMARPAAVAALPRSMAREAPARARVNTAKGGSTLANSLSSTRPGRSSSPASPSAAAWAAEGPSAAPLRGSLSVRTQTASNRPGMPTTMNAACQPARPSGALPSGQAWFQLSTTIPPT